MAMLQSMDYKLSSRFEISSKNESIDHVLWQRHIYRPMSKDAKIEMFVLQQLLTIEFLVALSRSYSVVEKSTTTISTMHGDGYAID